MSFWGRKKQKNQEEETAVFKSPCDLGKHKYKDFKWYMQFYQNARGQYGITVKEPYVCVHCGHREDVTLGTWLFDKKSDRRALADIFDKDQRFGSILDIENDIHDMQLVDREYLSILQRLHPGRKITDSSKEEDGDG